MTAVLDDDRIAEALRKSHGLVSRAARMLRCSRKAVYAHININPDLQEVLVDARELVTDDAEAGLYSRIKAKDPWAICFYLKTQGKDRGYVERQETQQVGDVTVKVEYVNSPEPDAS